METRYDDFCAAKRHDGVAHGFDPLWMPDFLFDFQKTLVDWAIRKGRCAIFADCGLGKTPMQLVWAENVRRYTAGRVLIVTPLAVGQQTVEEARKFGIGCDRLIENPAAAIGIINYERLHHLDPAQFSGVVCDESSVLKNYSGATRARVTDFLRKVPYRLLCTATAAPNDYTELGTSAEALGVMGHVDMLSRFFTNKNNNIGTGRSWGEAVKWRFKEHARVPFWRWVGSWARSLRHPSDVGGDDAGFVLPDLVERETIVSTAHRRPGELFAVPALNIREQREERRMTIVERCEVVSAIANSTTEPFVAWCHLNAEADTLEKMIPGSVQVSGAQTDEEKERRLIAFQHGGIRALVTKPRIGAFGLNWQHCSRVAMFPSYSYEQYYQAIRRCWRFGQSSPVTVDIVSSEGEGRVLAALRRKASAADEMFTELVRAMTDPHTIVRENEYTNQEEVPSWL